MNRRFQTPVFTLASLVALASLVCLSGCDKADSSGQATKETSEGGERPGAGVDCHERAVGMATRLEPFTRVQPTIEVPFALPQSTGRKVGEGTPVLVGPKFLRVDNRTFEVPEGVDPIANGGFSEEMVDQVRDAIVAEAKQEAKEAELLNSASEFVVLLGVHPEMPAGAVKPFFAGVDSDTVLALLAVDADAPALPERKEAKEIEPLLDRLDGAEAENEIEELTQELETKVAGDCRIAFFRMWVGDKTGASTLDRDMLLQQTPLAEAVAECGCDEVDLESLEAALDWAMSPPHAPLVFVPSNVERAFTDEDEAWTDVVERHARE